VCNQYQGRKSLLFCQDSQKQQTKKGRAAVRGRPLVSHSISTAGISSESLGDVNILGLVDAPGHEHHPKKYHQYGQDDPDNDVHRGTERLKLVEAKRCAYKAYDGQKTA
jgi:hypothetical protein